MKISRVCDPGQQVDDTQSPCVQAMRVLYPVKSVGPSWALLSFIFVVACMFTFYINLQLIRARFGNAAQSVSDAEIWKRLGIEATCHRFIKADPTGIPLDDIQAYRSNLLITRSHPPEHVKLNRIRLEINKTDVLVLLHIQKTGGTYLEGNLISNLPVQPPVTCRPMPGSPGRPMCECLNGKGQDWMFNRHCNGWPCGVHHSLDELTFCVDPWFQSQVNERRTRKYHYITVLRDPVTRFFSEWLHVRRGATWRDSRLFCGGREASLEEVPFCFTQGSWSNVTFDQFMNCSSNLAFNRQTRMLANMSLADCYKLHSPLSRQERDQIMLQSAKDNLATFFSFFGLVEHLPESQVLFEKTFLGFRFEQNLVRKKFSHYTNLVAVSEDHWNRIVEKNSLDVQLYQYAKDLLLQRFRVAKISVRKLKNEVTRVGEDFSYVFVEV